MVGFVKVYIAGPINGHEDLNKENFDKAKEYLNSIGFEPLSPLDIEPLASPHVCRGEVAQGGHNYGCYMIPDLKALLDCEGYTLLAGWEKSKGAKVEHIVAQICGIQYIHLPAPIGPGEYK